MNERTNERGHKQASAHIFSCCVLQFQGRFVLADTKIPQRNLSANYLTLLNALQFLDLISHPLVYGIPSVTATQPRLALATL